MILARGARLGPYEIRSLLGAGGMGEVYEAHDPRLDRTVAIKVLTSTLSSSPDIRVRFEREARTISRLSHPHICAVYDVGHDASLDFLVMELLQGETLADRLVRGPLPLEQTLRYGLEVADALAHAHRQGIVHRDLKPGNVMLTASGVKLLDFGLAKAVAPLLSSGPASAAPTAAAPAPVTEAGVIVGTLQYMAPEQLEGRPLDTRTDIFALGALIYEMATGKRAFVGTSPVAIASAVLHDDPAPISAVRPGSPVALDRLVRTCLAKDPEQRWQTAHDVGLQLASMGEAGSSVAPAVGPASGARSRGRWAWVPWAIAATAAAVALAAWLRPGPVPRAAATSMRFEIPPPAGGVFVDTFAVETITLAVSPDGGQIAFVASQPGSGPRIWLRPFSTLEPRPVVGTEGATSLFWAPDGRSIAFFVGDKLKRVDLLGGAAAPICDVPQNIGLFGTWGADGDILFAAISGQAIFRVSTTGGTPVAEIKPDPTRGEARVSWPWFLPDGRRFLYLNVHQDRTAWIMLGEHGKPGRQILKAASNAQYVDPGFLLFAREGTLVGQRFDAASAMVTGEPFSIAEPVRYFLSTAMTTFSTSRTGVLVYQSHTDRARLSWFDRTGADAGKMAVRGRLQNLRLSPDGRMVLFDRTQPQTGAPDLWSLTLADGAERRLTSDAGSENVGPWVSGTSVLFSQQTGATPPHMFRKDLVTDKEEELLSTTAFQEPQDVSPDGKTLVFTERSTRGDNDIWTLPLMGARTASPFVQSRFEECCARFSPDGHWIAFASDESGRGEVYVAPFPATGGKRLVSAGGGRAPRWSRDGRELFYLAADRHLMAVRVRSTPSLELGAAVPLFLRDGIWNDYDVAADGKRFLAVVPESSGNSQPLTFISNWIADVAR